MPLIQWAGTIIITILGSAGFWSWMQSHSSKKNAYNRLLVGIAHDRICSLGMEYIQRGYITRDEFENINDYLFEPYAAAGGNGSAKRIIEEVRKLPIKKG